MLQRNEGFTRPELVPDRVTVDEAEAALAAGRPQGTPSRVVVQGLRCPVVTAGEGKPVVFVHGLGHDCWDWAPIFARRPAGTRFVALDLPGFGLSDKPDRDYPLALLAEAVLAVCDEPAVVVGSSLGGHVAMLAALRAPAKVRGLLLLDTGGLIEAPVATQQAARAYYAEAAIVARSDADIVSNSRRIFATPTDVCERLAARKLAVHRSPLRAEFARPFARVVDDVFRHPVLARLGDLACPTAFVHGDCDVVVPVAPVQAAAARIGAPFTLLRGVGHTPHLESVDETMDVLLPFVDETYARGGNHVPR